MDLRRVKMTEKIQRQYISTLLEAPPGLNLKHHIGLVRGITVRSRNFIASFGAGIKSLVGGNIETFRTLCEDSRTEAYNRMIDEAVMLGANAVLGVRYEAHDIADGITEVLCYGTAVVLAQ